MASGVLLQIAGFLHLIVGIALIEKPLLQAVLYIFFRATFSLAAWNKVTLLGLPYFLPSLVLITGAAFYSWLREGSMGRLSAVFKVYLCFLYVISFAAILNFENFSTTMDVAIKTISPMMIYFLVSRGIREQHDIDRSLRLLMYSSLIPLCFAVYEALTSQIFAYSSEVDQITLVTRQSLRVASTIIDPNTYGIYLSLILFAIIPQLIHKKSKESIFFLGLVLFSLVASKNRGTWIALAVALTVAVAVFRKHLRVRYWLASAGAVVLLALPVVLTRFDELSEIDEYGQSKDTFEDRLAYGAKLWERSLDHFVFGSGLGEFSQVGPRSELRDLPHDDYIRVAVESGYIALVLYCAFLVAQYVRTVWYRSSPRWDIQFAASFVQLYVIIISFTQNLWAELTEYPLLMYILAVSHRATAFDQIRWKETGDKKTAKALDVHLM